MNTQLLLSCLSLILAGIALGWTLCKTLMIRFFAKDSSKEAIGKVHEIREKLYEQYKINDNIALEVKKWNEKYNNLARHYEGMIGCRVIDKTEYPESINTYFGEITDTDLIKQLVDNWRKEIKQNESSTKGKTNCI